MAIPSRQIGWSQKSNLLWQISKQLEYLSAVLGKKIPTTTTTTTAAPITYYNVAGCERMEYHVIKYTGAGTLTEGTIVSNDTPECWFVIDVATGPEDVGTIQQIWNTESDCQPCIAAHFSNEIYYGEDTPTACSQVIPIYARGNGTTFCNSDNFYSESFRTVGTGTIIISYEGQQKVVGVTSGSDLATYYGGCAACPTTTTTTTIL